MNIRVLIIKIFSFLSSVMCKHPMEASQKQALFQENQGIGVIQGNLCKIDADEEVLGE